MNSEIFFLSRSLVFVEMRQLSGNAIAFSNFLKKDPKKFLC